MVLFLAACGGGGKTVTMTQVCDDDETMSATVTVGYKDGTTPSETDTDEAELVNEGDYQVYLFAYVAPGSDLIDTETTDIEAIFNHQDV